MIVSDFFADLFLFLFMIFGTRHFECFTLYRNRGHEKDGQTLPCKKSKKTFI